MLACQNIKNNKHPFCRCRQDAKKETRVPIQYTGILLNGRKKERVPN